MAKKDVSIEDLQKQLATIKTSAVKKKRTFKIPKVKKSRHFAIFQLIIALALIVLIVVWLMPSKAPLKSAGKPIAMKSECTTRDCFVQAANACTSTTYTTSIETTTIKFTIKPGCVLNKAIIALDPEEPAEMVELFLNTNMDCTYSRGTFDTDFIDEISGPLETCSGSLVEAVNLIT